MHFLIAFILLFFLGCGQEPAIDLYGWRPQAYVDQIPIYSKITAGEVCVISSIHKSFYEKYKKRAKNYVSGVFIARSYTEKVPCIRNSIPPCIWDSQFRGLLGAAVDFKPEDGRTDFIFLLNTNLLTFSTIYIHECGHVFLNLSHKTEVQKQKFDIWQDEMQEFSFLNMFEDCHEFFKIFEWGG